MEKYFMQMAITFLAVVGGLIFSLAIALLAEELLDKCSVCFSQSRRSQSNLGTSAEAKGEGPCWL
jgi:hypothetical protein